MFRGPFDQSIIKRATDQHLVRVNYINIRDFSDDQYKSVDDRPYGGGHGMIMRVDILDKALEYAKQMHPHSKTRTILLDPQGEAYKQSKAKQLSAYEHLILLCGHYETIDDRVRSLVDDEISIGDYILTGGEIAAMVIVDSVVRLLHGVLKQPVATEDESFSRKLFGIPSIHQTRNIQNAESAVNTVVG